MIRAGLPATMQLSGTDFVTTEPAPIITLLPIVMSPITIAPTPIDTLSPIVAVPLGQGFLMAVPSVRMIIVSALLPKVVL